MRTALTLDLSGLTPSHCLFPPIARTKQKFFRTLIQMTAVHLPRSGLNSPPPAEANVRQPIKDAGSLVSAHGDITENENREFFQQKMLLSC